MKDTTSQLVSEAGSNNLNQTQRCWQKDFVMDVVSQRLVSGGLRRAFLVYMPGVAPGVALERINCACT